jgi:hypothetical protein
LRVGRIEAAQNGSSCGVGKPWWGARSGIRGG